MGWFQPFRGRRPSRSRSTPLNLFCHGVDRWFGTVFLWPGRPVLQVTDQAARGWALPGVSQSVYRAELLAVTLALERLAGSGRVVSDCEGAVKVVAALEVGARPPKGKHVDLERRLLQVGNGTPVTWIIGNKRPTWRQRRLPPPSPHMLRWQLWRARAEKFRLFWGTFGPTLARREREERIPQQPGRWSPGLWPLPKFTFQNSTQKSGQIIHIVPETCEQMAGGLFQEDGEEEVRGGGRTGAGRVFADQGPKPQPKCEGHRPAAWLLSLPLFVPPHYQRRASF